MEQNGCLGSRFVLSAAWVGWLDPGQVFCGSVCHPIGLWLFFEKPQYVVIKGAVDG
jgi:hypothetical protein